ncbi:hypothetical protein TAMA11512_16890 [Selenomonas sp. TAMA-11512]|uniref:hypothetical protein n=1 Tax=Selenomonas sp. TAMA-11512 TaxID=3095337 RepID=UPI0030931959|nr:hypothetical protein TAMA11512_16890 [Selenomonas sp. TAMA-11512]
MLFIFLKKGLLTMLAALLLGMSTSAAAPDAETQLDIIASSRDVWKHESPSLSAENAISPRLRNFDPSETRVAVTDLDANGRLELLVRHAARMKGNVPKSFAHLPTAVGMSVYEVSADGQLVKLTTNFQDDCPDLLRLGGVSEIAPDGTRRYNFRTSILSKDDSYEFVMAFQQFSIANGRVLCRTLAEEHGIYGTYDGKHFDLMLRTVNIYDGDPSHRGMDIFAFADTEFFKTFDNVLQPVGSVQWMTGAEFTENPRAALASSWRGFSYGAR